MITGHLLNTLHSIVIITKSRPLSEKCCLRDAARPDRMSDLGGERSDIHGSDAIEIEF